MSGSMENITKGDFFTGINFVNAPEKEFRGSGVFHRVLSLEAVLRILNPHSLNFSSPLVWTDPFEHFPYTHVKNQITPNLAQTLQDSVFAVCLTDKHITEAHWQAYTDSDIAVELEFYREKYLEEINKLSKWYHVYVGKVNYSLTDYEILKRVERNLPKSSEDSNDFNWFVDLLFLKRKDYRHENEIRVVLVKKNPDEIKETFRRPEKEEEDQKKKGKERFYQAEDFQCDVHELIRGIMIGPKTSELTYKMLEDVFRNNYGFVGVIQEEFEKPNRIRKSQLYRELNDDDSNNLSWIVRQEELKAMMQKNAGDNNSIELFNNLYNSIK